MSASILDGSGRFRLMSEPAAFPFKDVINGTPEGPVFDLVDLEGFDGVAYLKAEHVIEMAHVLGMSTKEETLEMRARISELERENSSLPANVERLLNGIDNLVTEFHSGIVTPADGLALLGIQADSKESNGDDKSGEAESPERSGKSESSHTGTGKEPKADGTTLADIKASHPSVSKGSNKLPASSADGFKFDDD